MGNVYWKQENWEEALRWFDKSMAEHRNPDIVARKNEVAVCVCAHTVATVHTHSKERELQVENEVKQLQIPMQCVLVKAINHKGHVCTQLLCGWKVKIGRLGNDFIVAKDSNNKDRKGTLLKLPCKVQHMFANTALPGALMSAQILVNTYIHTNEQEIAAHLLHIIILTLSEVTFLGCVCVRHWAECVCFPVTAKIMLRSVYMYMYIHTRMYLYSVYIIYTST